MQLREKIGSLFVVGFEGTSVPPSLVSLIRDHFVGGVIIFRRNISSKDQLKGLISDIKDAAGGRPLIISVDHEGGRVFRLPEPFTNFGPMADIKDPVHAYDIGRRMAEELKDAGFNLNYAPVLDVNTNIKNPVIGDRSFGSDARIVSKLGVALIRGLQENGIMACGKHFPGHGDTSLDSHVDFPKLPHTIKRLESLELIPFKAAIDAGVCSIMTAHVIYEGLDPENPATLSPVIINELLRHRLGYNGLVISDDLQMAAIAKKWSIKEACIKALKAGCDICLICRDNEEQTDAIEYMLHAVHAGIIPESCIDSSARRVSALFERYGLL